MIVNIDETYEEFRRREVKEWPIHVINVSVLNELLEWCADCDNLTAQDVTTALRVTIRNHGEVHY